MGGGQYDFWIGLHDFDWGLAVPPKPQKNTVFLRNIYVIFAQVERNLNVIERNLNVI